MICLGGYCDRDGSGSSVNCVAPGMVFTPMVRGRGMTEEMREARKNQNLMKTEGMIYVCFVAFP